MRKLLALFVALCAVPAFGSITLLAPAPHATLRGDYFATIAWSSDRPIDAEEWEAFLSTDGGKYYSIRLTPHLDLGLRTFQFLVPNVASDDARILMRTGDERVETIIEFPQRFSIRPSASAIFSVIATNERAPESARPGERTVVEWASGSRSGANFCVARVAYSAVAVRAIAKPLCSSRECRVPGAGRRNECAERTRHSAPGTRHPRDRVRSLLGTCISRNLLRLTSRLNV